jgi:hypothetical protein
VVAGKRQAAGEIEKYLRIAGTQRLKLTVHSETVLDPAAAGVVVAEQLQRFHVSRIATDESLEETDLDVEITGFPASDPAWFAVRHVR